MSLRRFQFRVIDLLIVCLAWGVAYIAAHSIYREPDENLMRANIAYHESWIMYQRLSARHLEDFEMRSSAFELMRISPNQRSALFPWGSSYEIVPGNTAGVECDSFHVSSPGADTGKPIARGSGPGNLNSWSRDGGHSDSRAATPQRQSWVFRTACCLFPAILIVILSIGWVATRERISAPTDAQR